jgi:nicotinamide-nucleotide amidase
MNAVLLTIGTEITSGEIVNSNAAWISLQLEELGARVLAHISVRDEESEILKALEWIKQSKIVIVTGGLGPTSDDKTRECMARFANKNLEFDGNVFQDLKKRIANRNGIIRENHKHQCYFPKESDRLQNEVGTALGFYFEYLNQHFFALPGPPRELESMWKNAVSPKLKVIIPQNSFRWFRWTCRNVPESEVAEAVEPILSESGLEVGYRAKSPEIFVKIYAHPEKHVEIIKNIELVLKPWLVK